MKRFFCVLLCSMCLLTGLTGTYSVAEAAGTEQAESRYALGTQFLGGSLVSTEYRTVYYAHKTESMYRNPYEVPAYMAETPNSCAVESGGNAIVYYDRIYTDLVPGYAPIYIFGGFTYGSQNTAVDNMFISLYNLMGTDSDGTTIDGFKSGFNAFVNGKGRTPQILSATGNYHNTNIDYIKTQLEQEKVAVIFLDTFSITAISGLQNYDGYDHISHSVYSGCHTMLVYGYYEASYYDANWNLITKDTYFFVSTGYNGARLALINIRDFCQIDDAYIINIV